MLNGFVIDFCEVCSAKDEDEPNVWAIFFDENDVPVAVQCVEHGIAAKLIQPTLN